MVSSGSPAPAAVNRPPLVSVIINCYNGEPYLQEAIDSVTRQTYPEWEIVFWDNASTDRSAAIALAVGPGLRYFRSPENLPLGAARNLALQEAKGACIVFLDCDDLLLPDALEVLVATSARGNYALVYGGSIFIDAAGRELKRRSPLARSGHLLGEQLRQFEIRLPAVMINRSALLASELGFDPTLRMAEEYCLFMQLAASHEICGLSRVLAKYRVHGNALTPKLIARWGPEVDHSLDLLASGFPAVVARHQGAFRQARARAAYYRACHRVVESDRRGAMDALWPYLFVDHRFPFLFLLLLLPLRAWNSVHAWYSGRSFSI